MSHSIIDDEKMCVVCGTEQNLHKHHIYAGRNRKKSEEYGCWCYLCADHHNMSNKGVHNDPVLDRNLKRICQHRMERAGMSRDEFVKIFGKSYL